MWLENYIKNNAMYDLVLRSPYTIKMRDVRSGISDTQGKVEISFSKLKNDSMFFFLTSMLYEVSSSNKISIIRKKGFSGQRVTQMSAKFKKKSLFKFMDFFLNLIIKGLKRRFITMKSSMSSTGVLNLRFSSFSELEIDDFFFFELDSWDGFLNFFINFSKKSELSLIYSLYFLNVFNLKKLLKYEVFSSKG